MLTYHTVLRGCRFRGGEAVNIVRLMNPGDRFVIEPDWENPYDPNALKCMVNDVQVGFVAKEDAANISPQMQEDSSLTAIAFFLADENDKRGNPNPRIFFCLMDADDTGDDARAAFDEALEEFELMGAPDED